MEGDFLGQGYIRLDTMVTSGVEGLYFRSTTITIIVVPYTDKVNNCPALTMYHPHLVILGSLL